MELKALIFLVLPLLAIARPLLKYTTIPYRPIIHDGKTLPADMKSAVIHARDSIAINISNSFSHANVSNSQNNAKFEVVNNAKNAAIALGNNSTHDVKLDSFGDMNMLNSTGSNTGGWKTKNRGSNISTDGRKRRSPVQKQKDGVPVEVPNMQHTDPNVVPEWYTKSKDAKMDIVNLNVSGAKIRGSNLTRSGTENTVEIYIAGGGQNVVNINMERDADNSSAEDSGNNNQLKVYIGKYKGNDTAKSTVIVVQEKALVLIRLVL